MTNTYQGILITNGEQSYAVFTYQCGLMAWSGGATVGFTSAGEFYQNHRLSGTPSITNIACLNPLDSEWTNIVYQLSKNIIVNNCLNYIHMISYIQVTIIFHFLSLVPLMVLLRSIFPWQSMLHHLLSTFQEDSLSELISKHQSMWVTGDPLSPNLMSVIRFPGARAKEMGVGGRDRALGV